MTARIGWTCATSRSSPSIPRPPGTSTTPSLLTLRGGGDRLWSPSPTSRTTCAGRSAGHRGPAARMRSTCPTGPFRCCPGALVAPVLAGPERDRWRWSCASTSTATEGPDTDFAAAVSAAGRGSTMRASARRWPGNPGQARALHRSSRRWRNGRPGGEAARPPLRPGRSTSTCPRPRSNSIRTTAAGPGRPPLPEGPGDGRLRRVEESMLTANEAVSDGFQRRDEPVFGRIHDAPDSAKLEAFGRSPPAAPCPSIEAVRAPKVMGRLLDAGGGPLGPAAVIPVPRSLKQARLDIVNVGHFGLASPAYSTSLPDPPCPDAWARRLKQRLALSASPGAGPPPGPMVPIARRRSRARTGHGSSPVVVRPSARRSNRARGRRPVPGVLHRDRVATSSSDHLGSDLVRNFVLWTALHRGAGADDEAGDDIPASRTALRLVGRQSPHFSLGDTVSVESLRSAFPAGTSFAAASPRPRRRSRSRGVVGTRPGLMLAEASAGPSPRAERRRKPRPPAAAAAGARVGGAEGRRHHSSRRAPPRVVPRDFLERSLPQALAARIRAPPDAPLVDEPVPADSGEIKVPAQERGSGQPEYGGAADADAARPDAGPVD